MVPLAFVFWTSRISKVHTQELLPKPRGGRHWCPCCIHRVPAGDLQIKTSSFSESTLGLGRLS